MYCTHPEWASKTLILDYAFDCDLVSGSMHCEEGWYAAMLRAEGTNTSEASTPLVFVGTQHKGMGGVS